MNRNLARLALPALVLACGLALTPNRAEARWPRVFSGPGGPTNLSPSYTAAPVSVSGSGYAGSTSSTPGADVSSSASYYNFPSYSYWTAAYYGFPPRIYSGYGSNDFPYYGQAYGSPSDPWSWPAMAGYSAGLPTRYNLMAR